MVLQRGVLSIGPHSHHEAEGLQRVASALLCVVLFPSRHGAYLVDLHFDPFTNKVPSMVAYSGNACALMGTVQWDIDAHSLKPTAIRLPESTPVLRA